MDTGVETIKMLSRKIVELEEERDHLKKLLESSVPLLREEQGVLIPSTKDYILEENIAKVQLAILDRESMQRELTLEETKKCEIYSKILASLRNSGIKKVDAEVGLLKSEDLIAQLEHGKES